MLASYDTPDFDTHAIDEALSYLRASQNVNGGWGLQRGQATDFFTSLHALLAIEQYAHYDFDTEISSGVAYVKTQQLADGSFGYGGVAVPYVTALASRALVRGETYPFSTATERAVTALRGQQLADGSWSGEPYDTAVAMLGSWDHDRPPKVNAGPDQNAVDADGNCVQTFTLAGSATSYNGSITSYAWSDNCLPVATGTAPIVTLPVGVHRLVLAATDSLGLVARDTAVVTVTESAQTTCGDSDLDGILNDGDGNGVLGDHPCRDGFAYGCDDNCPMTTNPNQSNVDRDEAGDACDCAASNAAVWSLPGQVTLTLSHAHTTGVTTISWGAPADKGGTQALAYDSLRSTSPSNFTSAATCLESNGTDTQSTDNAAPAAGSARHYLVRAENDCPARGSLGTGSNGVERPGRACP